MSSATQPLDPNVFKRVLDFLVTAFSAQEIVNMAKLLSPAVSEALPTNVSLANVAHCLVDTLQKHGLLNNSFLNLLAAYRPNRVQEIRSLLAASGGEIYRKPRTTYDKFMILLDRTQTWSRLQERCAASTADHVFLVHGTYNEDLCLFLERVRCYFHGNSHIPQHHIVPVPIDLGEQMRPESSAEWDAHIARTIRERATPCFSSKARGTGLVATVQHMTRFAPAFLIIHGPEGGGLRAQSGGKLSVQQRHALEDFLLQSWPKVLVARRKHPIRLMLPVEHPPYDGAYPADFTYEMVVRVGKKLGAVFDYLPEIEFPSWPEIRDELSKHMQNRRRDHSDVVLIRGHEIFKQMAEARLHHRHTFIGLAEELSSLVDEYSP